MFTIFIFLREIFVLSVTEKDFKIWPYYIQRLATEDWKLKLCFFFLKILFYLSWSLILGSLIIIPLMQTKVSRLVYKPRRNINQDKFLFPWKSSLKCSYGKPFCLKYFRAETIYLHSYQVSWLHDFKEEKVVMLCFYLWWYDISPGVVLQVILKAKLPDFILTVFLPLED